MLQLADTFISKVKETIVIDENVISLLTPWAYNYYHFLCDFVPRLFRYAFVFSIKSLMIFGSGWCIRTSTTLRRETLLLRLVYSCLTRLVNHNILKNYKSYVPFSKFLRTRGNSCTSMTMISPIPTTLSMHQSLAAGTAIYTCKLPLSDDVFPPVINSNLCTPFNGFRTIAKILSRTIRTHTCLHQGFGAYQGFFLFMILLLTLLARRHYFDWERCLRIDFFHQMPTTMLQ